MTNIWEKLISLLLFHLITAVKGSTGKVQKSFFLLIETLILHLDEMFWARIDALMSQSMTAQLLILVVQYTSKLWNKIWIFCWFASNGPKFVPTIQKYNSWKERSTEGKCRYGVYPNSNPVNRKSFTFAHILLLFSSQYEKNSGDWVWIWVCRKCTLL